MKALIFIALLGLLVSGVFTADYNDQLVAIIGLLFFWLAELYYRHLKDKK